MIAILEVSNEMFFKLILLFAGSGVFVVSPHALINAANKKSVSQYLKLKDVIIKLPPTFRALCCWDIYFRLPTTAAKFIIKSSLFVQKFKDAGQAQTEDWLCF